MAERDLSAFVARCRFVFEDNAEVASWQDTETYHGAETYTHLIAMHRCLLDAADIIEKLIEARNG